MTNWVPLLVRVEDYSEFAAIVVEREADRGDAELPGVTLAAVPRALAAEERDDLAGLLAVYPSWSEDALRRLAAGTALTAQRWARALDVVAASDDQTWFTTSEIAEKSGMAINEWRDAPRKLPQHLKANYPDAPRHADGSIGWPLLAKSITSAEVSWAMTPETKAIWRRIRSL